MGLFYKITSANGRDSYLFGTMHVNHPDVVALPIEVKEAFDCSDDFVQQQLDTWAKAPEIVQLYCIEWMFHRRNKNMVKRMLPYLEKGNAFFAVGAAHLMGIVNLLKEQDCSITSIPLSQRCHPISPDTPMYYSQLASAFFPKNPPPMPEAKRLLSEEEQNDGFTMVDWAEKAPISNPDENEDFVFIPQ